jgi:integrase/recombinase XerD
MSLAKKQQQKPSQFALKQREVQKIINAAPTYRDRCLIRLLADTGIRRAELAALDIRDLDFGNLRLTIRSGKGDKQRIVPITETLGAELRHLVGKNAAGPLFVSRLGSAMRPREINRIVERTGDLAGVRHPDPNRKSINPHLLRHTFAHNWKKQRGDYEALQQILGHASIATTVDAYGRLSVEDIQDHYRELMDKALN